MTPIARRFARFSAPLLAGIIAFIPGSALASGTEEAGDGQPVSVATTPPDDEVMTLHQESIPQSGEEDVNVSSPGTSLSPEASQDTTRSGDTDEVPPSDDPCSLQVTPTTVTAGSAVMVNGSCNVKDVSQVRLVMDLQGKDDTNDGVWRHFQLTINDETREVSEQVLIPLGTPPGTYNVIWTLQHLDAINILDDSATLEVLAPDTWGSLEFAPQRVRAGANLSVEGQCIHMGSGADEVSLSLTPLDSNEAASTQVFETDPSTSTVAVHFAVPATLSAGKYAASWICSLDGQEFAYSTEPAYVLVLPAEPSAPGSGPSTITPIESSRTELAETGLSDLAALAVGGFALISIGALTIARARNPVKGS